MRLSPHGTHFTGESTEAMQIKCLAQGHNILMPGYKPSTSVSRNQHSYHMTNMLHKKEQVYHLMNVVLSCFTMYIHMYI